jgi:hypothetical protein
MSALDPANLPEPRPLNSPADPIAAANTAAISLPAVGLPAVGLPAVSLPAVSLSNPSNPSNGPASDVPTEPAGTPRRARRLPTVPLFFWLLVQVGALALAAGRVPLAARYPSTGERYALDLLLGAQVGFAALLFPWLLRDLFAAELAIASCWPALALAVMLSAFKPGTLPIVGGYVTLWLAVLTAWRFALPSEKSQLIGSAVAATWAIGGPVVWYMRAEFNSPMQTSPNPGPFFGPLTGALAQVDGNASGGRASDWIVLAVLLVAGVFAAWIVNLLRRRRTGAR